MFEKFKPFMYGVTVEETCSKGYRGWVSLIRPDLMTDKQYRKYVSLCLKACSDCKFNNEQFCLKIDNDGNVEVETINGRRILNQLKISNAPCVQNKVERI